MKRKLAWAAVLIAAVFGLLATVYALRDVLIAPRLTALLRETAQDRLGLEVSIGRMQGSLLADLEVTDVQAVEPAAAGPLSALSVKRLRLRYSLFTLLKGWEAFIGAATIEADALGLDLDLRRLADASRPGAGPAPALVLPTLRLRDASLAVTGDEAGARLEGISLETSTSAGGHTKSLEVSVSKLEAFLFRPDHTDPGLALIGRLDLAADTEWPLASPDTASARLVLRFSGHSRPDNQPVDLQSEIRLEQGRLQVDRLDLAAWRSRAAIREAGAPWRTVAQGAGWPLLQETSGSFSFISEDIPHFLRATGAAIGADAAVPAHRLTLEGRLDAGTLSIPQARLESGENAIRLQNLVTTLKPTTADSPLSGVLSMDVPNLALISSIFHGPPLAGRVQARARVAGTLGAPQGRASVSADDLALGTFPLGRLTLQAEGEQRQVRVETLELARGDDHLRGRGIIRLPEARLEGAAVDFSIRDLAPYGERLIPIRWRIAGERPRIQGGMQGSAVLAGPWDDPDGSLHLDFQDLRIRKQGFGSGSARLGKQGRMLVAHSIELGNMEDRLALRGSFDTAACRFGATRLEINASRIDPYLAAFGVAEPALSGRAVVSLEGTGSVPAPDFKANFFLGRMQAGGTTFTDIQVRTHGAGRRIRIESAESDTVIGRLRLSADLDRNPADGTVDLTLGSFAIRGEDLSLALTTPARIRYKPPGVFTVSEFKAGGPIGSIALKGTLAIQGRSELSLQLSELKGGPWIPKLTGMPLVVDGLNASLQAAGTAAVPEVSASGTVRKLGTEDAALSYSGRFDLAYSAKRLRVQTFDLTGPEGHRLTLTGSLPIDPAGDQVLGPGTLAVDAAANLPDLKLIRALFPAWPIVSGSLEADLSLRGTWRSPDGRLRLKTPNLIWADASGIPPPGTYAAHLEASLQGDRLTLEALQVQNPLVKLHGRGAWRNLPPLPQLISGKTAIGGSVALDGRLVAADLGWLARSFGGIRRTAGRLEIELKADGHPRDPNLQADIRLTEGELRSEANIPPIQAVDLQARLSGRDLEIRSLTGRLGGAPFHVAGVAADILRLNERGRIDLRLKGENLLLYRSETLRARADADLRLTGPWRRMEAAGTLALTESHFGKNLGLLEGLSAAAPGKPGAAAGVELFSIKSPPLRDAVFNIGISARESVQIQNNLVKGSVRPDLRLSGTGETPILTGRIYVDPSTLYLPAGRMRFERGIISFDPSHPGQPALDLVGTSQMLGYDITAVVEGRVDEPAVTLSSVPPLPDEELLLLILAGRPPQASGRSLSEKRQGLNVAVFLGRDMLTRIPGEESTGPFQSVLERFDVELGRRVTRAGDETIDARFRLKEGLLQERDTLYITGEKDAYDYYNVGLRIVFRFR